MSEKEEKDAILARVLEIRIARFGEEGGQAAIAKAMGLSQNYYDTYEKRSIMKPGRMKQFCDITGARAEYILTGNEPKWQKDDLNTSPYAQKVLNTMQDVGSDEFDAIITLYKTMKEANKKDDG